MARVNVSVEIDPQYNRKTNPNKKGEYPIHIILRKLRQKVSIIPDIENIPLNQFTKGKANWISSKHPRGPVLNQKISEIVVSINGYILTNGPKTLTPKQVKGWYQKNHLDTGKFEDFRNSLFLDYCRSITFQGKSLKTIDIYKAAFGHLEAFNKSLRFFEINRRTIENFAEFLQFERELSGSSARMYFLKIKTIYTKWYSENYPDDPMGYIKYFGGIKFKNSKPKENTALTADQFKKVCEVQLEPGSDLELTRDIFVFMCFTSRYMSEVKRMKFENVRVDPNNLEKIFIDGTRSKTGKVPFTNIIFEGHHRAIFDKYKSEVPGPLFPKLAASVIGTNVSFNYRLEILSGLAGVGFKMTIKTARVTFNSLIAKDFDRLVIRLMMGHENEQTQQKYNSRNIDLYARVKGLI